MLTYGSEENTVAVPSQELKDDLLKYLDTYKMLTDWLEIEDGKDKTVNFSCHVKLFDGFSKVQVTQKINDALKSFMNIDTRDMGEPLRISDVYALIDGIDGVSFVELDSPSETITPESNELLTLGTVTISWVD